MIRAVCLAVLTLWGMTAAPASAVDKQLVTESRHPTAMERRAGREKIQKEMEKDGFGPVPRIVGGHSAADGEYPWMVALLKADEPDEYDGFYCGASLVHPYWVLTAAHCVLGSRAEDINVLVGTNDLSNPGSGAQRIAVSEIVISPTYNEFSMDGDFALLRLAQPATGTTIPVIDDAELALPEVEATVTGWGDTTDGQGSYPNRLQEVELPIADLDVANASPAYAGTLTENMIPAGLAEGGLDSCQGDSGGPLLVPSPRAPGWALAGIVSFGEGCAEPGNYGIYTRIGNYRDFITGHIRPNYAAWERANGRSGENLDLDENGRTNFEEWALPDGGVITKSVSGGFLYLSYLRPFTAPEAEYYMEHATTVAGPWSAVAGSEYSVENAVPAGMGKGTWRLPQSADNGVYRVRVRFSSVLAQGDRPLSYPDTASGQLGTLDRTFNSRLYQTYALDFPSGTGPVAISLRSVGFDAALKVEALGNGGGIVPVETNAGIGLDGTDEWYEFTPEEGRSYRIWATTTASGEAGAFQLNVFDPVALEALPLLAVPRAKALSGSLSSSDVVDPVFLPGATYYKDDYLLDTSSLTTGKLVEFHMTSKGSAAKGIDDFLSLIDGESGRLVAGNDNFAGKSNDAGLRFVPIPGKSYLLRASSSEERDIGLYQLAATAPVAGAKKSSVGAISIGGSASGKLSAASELDEQYLTFKYDYLFNAGAADQEVVATLESAKFDAYLIVIDATDLTVVTEGDIGGPAGGIDNARATFTARAGRHYMIRATTYDKLEKGAYVLKATAAP
ncbi:serine protease [Luteolibacter soli]|uniref:Serine protease n=1 Tax=Luteolibacter soli TaxID=3135280 RepID=A0ABU9ASQ8_9BACT